MPTDVIGILDTAVKIGLGAIISGLSTYRVASLNHSKEAIKELRQRKLNIIEASVVNVDEYFKALSKLISAADGIQRMRSEADEHKLDLNDKDDNARWNFLYDVDQKFVEARDHKAYAVSKLRLIGATATSEILNQLVELEQEVRLKLIFDKHIPRQEDLQRWRDKLSSVKSEFFTEICKQYIS
ncbi:hypothetical protein E4633_08890 [Geomonas terrae]|uniref:Uncharacterized protein n=1 Tax=Geomonas terrae TaxID=2562681 RepID=A0A4S1CGE8_9BACT|nr:hypothetical protein [Geomonas terrae]TGU72413.1 hypothetical protein E4633_08890 [Geomonas terrae]